MRRSGRAALRKNKTMASSGGQPQQAGRRLRPRPTNWCAAARRSVERCPPKVAQWRELGPEATAAADVKRQMERAAAKGARTGNELERRRAGAVGGNGSVHPAPGDGAAQAAIGRRDRLPTTSVQAAERFAPLSAHDIRHLTTTRSSGGRQR